MRIAVVLGINALVATSLVAAAGTASAVTMVVLPTLPGGTFTYAQDINDAGAVVGMSSAPDRGHAVRWDNGVVTDLGGPDGLTDSVNERGEVIGIAGGRPVRWSNTGAITELAPLPDDEGASVRDLDDAGTAVGMSINVLPGAPDPIVEQHAVRWNPAGEPTALPVPAGTTNSFAAVTNDNGVIAGSITVPGQGTRAVRWNTDGTVTALDFLPGGTSASVKGINDAGEIIGTANGAPGGAYRDVRWTARGAVSPLPNLRGGSWSVAADINDKGTIAGYAGTAGLPHGVRWSSDDTITDLGTLPGHDSSMVMDINEAGTAVGDSELSEERPSARAVRWEPNGKITNLGLIRGGTYSLAHGINENGVIFGHADDADGENRVVVWR